ncbi:MAG: hypothetical protein AAGF12_22200 [Myxococcota bacterium]
MVDHLPHLAAGAHERRARGGVESVAGLVQDLIADGSELSGAWALSLCAQSLTLGVPSVASVSPAEVTRFLGGGEATRDAISRALAHFTRLAVLAFDVEGLRTVVEFQKKLAEDSNDHARLHEPLTRAWLSWVSGEMPQLDLAELGRHARAQQLADVVIEAQVLEALLHLSRDEIEAATAAARRASRMARSEGLPDGEILASLVLARIRRFQSQSHLSLRILAGLVPHAPPRWRPWIQWEAVLAGALSVRGVRPESLAGALITLTEAVRSGRIDETTRATHALISRAGDAVPLRRDALTAAALLAPEEVQDDAIERWRSGETAELPRGIAGFAFASATDPRQESACARVVVPVEGPARRIVALATALAIETYRADAAPSAGPTRPRTDTGLSTLALAAHPVDASDYFRRVYEFSYEAATHRAMLNMHVKRMRERLGDTAEIDRDDGTLRLSPRRPLVLRDPRCEEPLAQRTLRILAVAGRQSANHLAAQLKVPLRTVQRILRDLHADAGVVQVKEGRAVSYQIEDTTFSEPTRSRRFDTDLFAIDTGGLTPGNLE